MGDESDLVSLVRLAIRKLVNDFNWLLLPEEEFVTRCAGALAEKPAMKPIQAGQNVYSQVLYDACRDVCRQEQAYMELHYYLHRIACHRRPDVAEDATQEALLLVLEQIDTCHNPRTFLRFAQFKLLQAIKTVDRHPPPPEGSPVDDLLWLPSEELAPPDDQADDLLCCIRQVWKTHPRARDQLRVVLWKYFDESSDEEIAEKLNTTPAQVHVLRSRGMKRLRQCVAGRKNAEGHEFSGRSARNRVGRAL